MQVGKGAGFVAGAVVILAVACSSPAPKKAAPSTTTTTIDLAAPGQSQTPPRDFPAHFKVPPGFTVVNFQSSGAPGDVQRKLSATWRGPGDPVAVYGTETSLLLNEGWTINGVVGAGKTVTYPGAGFFRVVGYGWAGLGGVAAVSPSQTGISVTFHQPGIDTPTS